MLFSCKSHNKPITARDCDRLDPPHGTEDPVLFGKVTVDIARMRI